VTNARFYAFPGSEAVGSARYPRAGITLAAAGPMKAGRDGENRARVFRSLAVAPDSVVALTQIHSRIVHVAESAAPFRGLPEGDGILTRNRDLVPSVTVADCMPIWLFDPVTGCFGVLHSGWKGTGIVRAALELAREEWGAVSGNFRVILGPHIRSCCYTVDAERAEFFTRTFGPATVSTDSALLAAGNRWPYRLSLAEANKALLAGQGVPAEHVLDVGECTACDNVFGSNRREGPEAFTHMAAFIQMR